MKKTKTLYLWLVIGVFIVLRIPYFQNVSTNVTIQFFAKSAGFVKIYPWILFLGMIEWFLIALYIQALIQSVKNSEPTKFDLNK